MRDGAGLRATKRPTSPYETEEATRMRQRALVQAERGEGKGRRHVRRNVEEGMGNCDNCGSFMCSASQNRLIKNIATLQKLGTVGSICAFQTLFEKNLAYFLVDTHTHTHRVS